MYIKNFNNFLNEVLLNYTKTSKLNGLQYSIKINWNPLNNIQFLVSFNTKTTSQTFGDVVFTTNKNLFYSIINLFRQSQTDKEDLYLQSKKGRIFDIIETFVNIIKSIFDEYKNLICLTFTGSDERRDNLYRFILKRNAPKYGFSYYENESTGYFYLYRKEYSLDEITRIMTQTQTDLANKLVVANQDTEIMLDNIDDDLPITDDMIKNNIRTQLKSFYSDLSDVEIEQEVKKAFKKYKKGLIFTKILMKILPS